MPYGRTSRISRSLDESELLVDEKIADHIASAVPADVYAGASIALGYEWMKEDLALRSAKADQLAQEQRLAYAASERKALADQVDRQNRDDDETLSVLGELNELVKGGMSAAEAKSKIIQDNPGRLMNARLTSAIADYGESAFDAERAQAEKDRAAIERISNAMKLEDLTEMQKFRRDNKAEYDRMRENMFNTEKIDAEIAAAEAEDKLSRVDFLKERRKQAEEFEKDELALRHLEVKEKLAIQKGEKIDPRNLDKKIKLQQLLGQGGLGPVKNVTAVIDDWGESEAVMGMLMDSEWLAAQNEHERDLITSALNKDGTNDTTREYEQAAIEQAAGRWLSERGESTLERAKRHEEGLKRADKIRSLRSEFDKKMEDAGYSMEKEDLGAMAVADVDSYSGVQGIEKIIMDAKNEIEKASKMDETDDAKKALSAAMGKFYSRIQDVPDARSSAPRSSAGSPAQPEIQIGEVRNGYKFKGGDPADKANWEKQ